MRAKELPRIDSIFRKNEDGNYYPDALLYQYILKYSVVLKIQNENKTHNDDNSFTVWELAGWMIGNEPNLIKKYGVKPKKVEEIKENIQMRFKRKLNHLMDLYLIEKRGTRSQAKGMGAVALYKYTEYGSLLALIIETWCPSTDQKSTENEIFNLLCLIFPIKEDSPASAVFYSKFFRKCKDKEVFRKIVNLIGKVLSGGAPIVSIIDLFRHVLQLDFEDRESRDYFNNLLDETIDELDAKSRELILYSLKLDIERKMEEQVQYFERFEKMRFKVRADPDKITLECFCMKCKFVPIQISLSNTEKHRLMPLPMIRF
jgi:hypothetical protein